MPTQFKIDKVSELKEKLEKCSIAVTANYSNISVNEMTDLRRRTREAGFEFVVIKNSLLSLAADAAQVPQLKEVMQGPTAIAFGYDEPVDVAKTLHEYIRTTRSALAIQGAIMGNGPALQTREVERLATLPPKSQLVSQLLGQLQAPMYGLLYVLNGPLLSFGRLLQARVNQLETEGSAAVAEAEPAAAEPAAAEAEPATTEEPAATEEAEPDVAEEPAEPAEAAEAEVDEQPEAVVEAEGPVAEEASSTDEAEAVVAEEPEATAEDESGQAESGESEETEAKDSE